MSIQRALAAACFLLVAMPLISKSAYSQESGWIGVEVRDMFSDERVAPGCRIPDGVASVTGIEVIRTFEGGPAQAAGLTRGDVILSLEGTEILSVKAFVEAVARKPSGTPVRLTLLRRAREQQVDLVLASRASAQQEQQLRDPQEAQIAAIDQDLGDLLRAGKLDEMKPLERRYLELTRLRFGESSPELARNLSIVANRWENSYRLHAAEQLMRQALEIDELNFGAEHPTVTVKRLLLARLLRT